MTDRVAEIPTTESAYELAKDIHFVELAYYWVADYLTLAYRLAFKQAEGKNSTLFLIVNKHKR